jgi:outer membrane lipoprotein carrier protein
LERYKQMDREKSWPRRRRRIDIRRLVFGLTLLWLSPVGAQAPTALDDFLRDTQTLTADFTQTIYDELGEVVEESQGSMAMQRPNRFNWRYAGEGEQVIVADGEGLWIYDEALAQATHAPLDAALAETPALLLSGDAEYREGFDIIDSGSQAKQSWIVLAPKRAETDFRRIRLDFNAGMLAAMLLEDSLNQRTRIEFSAVNVNTQLDAALFEFVAPEGVDVIGGSD